MNIPQLLKPLLSISQDNKGCNCSPLLFLFVCLFDIILERENDGKPLLQQCQDVKACLQTALQCSVSTWLRGKDELLLLS